MDVTFSHCAGLDVHKKTVVACCLTPGPQGAKGSETRTFSTMTADLLALHDWLLSKQVTHVAMESTGEFWKPVYNLLEPSFQVWVVNAQHIKAVPGRKTDVGDAAWIADLLRHGLVRPSFIPPLAQRDLRDLTRERTNLVQERAAVVRRLHKVLEWANIKLSAVATDVTGVSGRAMLAAIVAGEENNALLAELAQGKLRSKRAALEAALAGRVREHHRFLLAQHLMQIDFLDEQIASYSERIQELIAPAAVPPQEGRPAPPSAPPTEEPPSAAVPPGAPASEPLSWAAAQALLDTIPGVGPELAEMLLAEIGPDMSRFRSAAHLASWAKLAPGNNESAGKRRTSSIGHGNRWLRSGLVQAAHAAVKRVGTHLHAVYRRLVARHGVKKAIIAIAHRLIIAIYHVVSKQEPYREVGEATAQRDSEAAARRLIRQGEQLGFQVTLTPKLAA
jgi:transposase